MCKALCKRVIIRGIQVMLLVKARKVIMKNTMLFLSEILGKDN